MNTKNNHNKHWNTRGRTGSVTLNGYRSFSRGNRTNFVKKYEHRMVMEQFIGRLLNKDEYVHHKDGNRLNNNIDNLEIISRSEHSRIHALQRGFGKNTKRPTWYGNQYGGQLSKEKIDVIYEMFDKRVTGKMIAKILNISESVVSKYKNKWRLRCQ